jgi:hypothetical protein
VHLQKPQRPRKFQRSVTTLFSFVPVRFTDVLFVYIGIVVATDENR